MHPTVIVTCIATTLMVGCGSPWGPDEYHFGYGRNSGEVEFANGRDADVSGNTLSGTLVFHADRSKPYRRRENPVPISIPELKPEPKPAPVQPKPSSWWHDVNNILLIIAALGAAGLGGKKAYDKYGNASSRRS